MQNITKENKKWKYREVEVFPRMHFFFKTSFNQTATERAGEPIVYSGSKPSHNVAVQRNRTRDGGGRNTHGNYPQDIPKQLNVTENMRVSC